MIVLDTSILSLAFRRRRRETDEEPLPLAALRKLIADDAPLAVPGIVLQELLSGVRSGEQFPKTDRRHGRFSPLAGRSNASRPAAQISNACRHHGVACSTIDAPIAAQVIESNGRLFTTDADFGWIVCIVI